MLMKKNHMFHMVDLSPWPLLSSFSAMTVAMSLVGAFFQKKWIIFITSFIFLLLISLQWWRDISRESTFQGLHTLKVVKGLKLGMTLFIISELFFFISFFWSFFHSSLSPTIEIGVIWPPMSITPFNPMNIPLLNTLILLSSGVTITWSHHSLVYSNLESSKKSLMLTLILAIYFSVLQSVEYSQSSFSIADSIYGATFFLATGFHGIHVLVGASFLSISLLRLKWSFFSSYHHFGFEAAAWYWHFVDVVWLFLYVCLYWWGS